MNQGRIGYAALVVGRGQISKKARINHLYLAGYLAK